MGLLSGTLLLLLRLATALNPLQKLLVEGDLRRRPDWVDGSAAQVVDHFLRVFKTDHRVDAGGFIRVGSRRRHETLRVGPHARPT